MNQSYKDIITIIQRHGPITTGEVCEHLEPLGYGGGMKWQDFRDTIAKQLGYLKSKGELTGEDRPQPKGKPLRYWSLAESQPKEMVSDVAEVEAVTEECSATVQENLTVETPETFTDTWTTPIGVEFKAAVRLTPMSVSQAMSEFYSCGYDIKDLEAFLTGIEFAEKHHGISR